MNISNSELKLLELIWENEPLKSGELVKLAAEKLEWKKSTVYTILKKLVNKNAVENENAAVKALIARDDVVSTKAENIKKTCAASLPMFITAFLNNEKLTREEAQELKKLIDSYTEE